MIIQRCSTTGDYVAFQKINGRPHLAYAPTLTGAIDELKILMEQGQGDDSRALKRMVKVEKKG